ncbi:hypothetical protein D8M04_04075 [Oceanobacillus piezotolerans]|uniref:DUF2268 domain-containing protein n=1 Tax=Oceanobacillus piezotolerans TaxID=2448030 RepID=A0A498DED7_9BACI|nr:DUF2268 domain-containing putative Zn-dependent protease [Oceanobacillus piezotolerans]RLL48446.1 hypothetical protein D8M04_04075 [Oceanobacillus piezotolerans]
MRHLIKLSILIAFLIFITACSYEKEKNKEVEDNDNISPQTTYQFSHNGQEFEIIPFYEEVFEYTGLMKENSELDNEETYTEYVLKPFKDESSLNYIKIGDPLSPTTDVEQLEKNTKELFQNQEKINKWIEEALSKSAEQLSGEDTSIYIFPVNPEDWFTIDNLEGVGGFAYFGNNILLNIHPSVSEETLKYTVAHEYHHTVNFLYNGEQSIYSLLDSILTEGKADSFASIIYPEKNASWIETLSDEEEKYVLEELAANYESTDRNIYNNFTYGNPAKDIPRWSDYKIGYQITESFIQNNPDTKILDWTKMDAKELVKASEYSDLIK